MKLLSKKWRNFLLRIEIETYQTNFFTLWIYWPFYRKAYADILIGVSISNYPLFHEMKQKNKTTVTPTSIFWPLKRLVLIELKETRCCRRTQEISSQKQFLFKPIYFWLQVKVVLVACYIPGQTNRWPLGEGLTQTEFDGFRKSHIQIDAVQFLTSEKDAWNAFLNKQMV